MELGDCMIFNIWVTTACNMQCKYCYENVSDIKQTKLWLDQEMADKIVYFIINYMKKRNKKEYIVVNFHGGEPLLNFKMIKKMVDKLSTYFTRQRLLFGVTTNALLLEKNEIMEFVSSNFDYSLSISIDGIKEAHDYNRIDSYGVGTYERVERNLKRLLNLNNRVRARMTITPETIAYFEESVDYLYSLGVKTIVPILDMFSLKWTQEKIQSYTKQLVNIHKKYESYEDVSIGPLKEIKCRQINGDCDPLREAINICSDGKIYPCTYSVGIEESEIGNIFDRINFTWLKNILMHNKEENDVCDGCNHYRLCRGTRSKIVNKILTGDYNTPSPILCSIENAHIEAEKHF